MKASRIYVSLLTVEGRGDFPWDMLRYDRCVPYTGEDASKMDRISLETRTIRLQMYSVVPAGPTVDRWKSFGWTVVSSEAVTL